MTDANYADTASSMAGSYKGRVDNDLIAKFDEKRRLKYNLLRDL